MPSTIDTPTIPAKYTERFRAGCKQSAKGILEMARVAAEVRDAYGYPAYIVWLEAECGMASRTGDRLLAVHRTLLTANLAVDLETIGPSALYLLASDSTSAEVRDVFVEKAKNGEPVTHSEVKAAVQQAKPVHADPETRQWLDDVDPLLAKHRAKKAEEDDENTAGEDDAEVSPGLARSNIAHTVTRRADPTDVPPTRRSPAARFCGALANVQSEFNSLRDLGGASSLASAWREDERADYLKHLNELRSMLDGWIKELESVCRKSKRSA